MGEIRDGDKDAITKQEIYLEAKARLQLAEEVETENRIEALRDIEFANGEQWPTDIQKERRVENRPSLTINHTDTFVRRVCNALRETRPRIKAHPVSGEADGEVAEIINGLVRHIEESSKASIAYDVAGESAVRIGWGYARVHADWSDEKSFEQELRIVQIPNTFAVYMDPSAQMPDGSDAEWVIITEKMKRRDFKRKYPQEVLNDISGKGPGDDELAWESKHTIRVAEYFRITKKPEKLYEMQDGTTVFESELPDKDLMAKGGYDFARDANDKPICRPSFRRQIEWHKLNGCAVVDSRMLPGKYIPVARCEGIKLEMNGRVIRKGMIRDLVDTARMYNYWMTLLTEVVALAPKAPWVMAEGQADGHDEWDHANQRSYSRLEYKPQLGPDGTMLPPPMRQAPVQVPAGIADAAQRAASDLMALAGMPHEPGQDSAGQVVSGIAIQRRQSLSDISHFQFFDNQTLFVAQLGRILLDLIPHYYSTQRMLRIIGDDGLPTMTEVNAPAPDPELADVMKVKNDLTVGQYDVVMDAGPGYQTKREEGAAAMLELLRTPLGNSIVKVGSDLIVRNLDFAGAGDLADRLAVTTPEGLQKAITGLPKQAQTIVNSLQSQLQEAQQQIEHLTADLKYGLTKVHVQDATRMAIERMKDVRAEKDTATDAQVRAFDTQTRSHTARDVAEINAAGHILQTHAAQKSQVGAANEILQDANRAQNENLENPVA